VVRVRVRIVLTDANRQMRRSYLVDMAVVVGNPADYKSRF